MLSLDPKQASFNRGGAAQTPEQACQSKYEFLFNSGASIVIGCDGNLEGGVVFSTLQGIDDCFSRQSMANGISSRSTFAFFRLGPRAELGVSAVSLDLSEGGHFASG
jgi:hypothetical protein